MPDVPDVTTAPDVQANPYRLPRTVRPRRYDLTLEPDLDAATFSGEETIAVEVVEPTDAIVLNAAEIEIDDAVVDAGAASGALGVSVELDEETERLTLRLDETLAPGQAEVRLRFRGVAGG